MTPIFVRTRHKYESYTDFWKLVELSGFETCYVDQIDLARPKIFVVTPLNGEVRPHLTNCRRIHQGIQSCRIIWWNLERPDSDRRSLSLQAYRDSNSEVLNYVSTIWVSDRYLASLDPRTVHVVLGSHLALAEGSRQSPRYDLAHMSYVNWRRALILDRLKDFRIAPNSGGRERDTTLASTPVMLNIHQTSAPICEPLRFALSAPYGMALVSEECLDPYPLIPGVDVVMAKHNELASLIRSISPSRHSELGMHLQYRLTQEWTFRRGVEEGLKRSYV